jgi:hypothetical protein
MRLVLHPKVFSDIDEIVRYYERIATQGLADEFYTELRYFIMRIFVQLNWLVRRACKEVSFFLMKRSQENFYLYFNTVRQPATAPLLKIASLLVLTFLAASCAARKPPPPLPVYPPISESAVRQLRYLPSTPYDRLDTTTIEAESGTQYISALQNARQAAARQGGNAMILVEDTEFRKKIKGRQSLVRRTIFWVVHLK